MTTHWELLNVKLDTLRETAKCRCFAVAKKFDKLLKNVEHEPTFQPCCWVCCDCSIDRLFDEWGDELDVEVKA